MQELPFEPVSFVLERMSGLIKALGIQFEPTEQGMRCRMTVDAIHTGAPDIAHGGSVMTLMDTALGVHALAHAAAQDKMTSTVEMKTNFLRPVRVGQTLITETTIQSAGQSLLVVSGHAWAEDTGKRVAFAVGTFNLYEGELADSFRKLLDSMA